MWNPYPDRAIDIRPFLELNEIELKSASSPFNSLPSWHRDEFRLEPPPRRQRNNQRRPLPATRENGMTLKGRNLPLAISGPYLITKKDGKLRLPRLKRSNTVLTRRRRQRKILRNDEDMPKLDASNNQAEANAEGDSLASPLAAAVDAAPSAESCGESRASPCPSIPVTSEQEKSLSNTDESPATEKDVVELPSNMPIALISNILSFMKMRTILNCVFEAIGSVGAVQRAAQKSGMLATTQEILASLFLSETFESQWLLFISRHRKKRREALDAGDMDVDVEGSAFPPEMGRIDQDLPVWKSEFDDSDRERIEASDRDVMNRHLSMVKHFIDFLMADDVAKLERVDYSVFLSGNGEGMEANEKGENSSESKSSAPPPKTQAQEEERLLELAISESLSDIKENDTWVQLPPIACFEVFGGSAGINSVICALAASCQLAKTAQIRILNLDGCVSLSEAGMVKCLNAVPNLVSLRANGARCFGEECAEAIRPLKKLRYLDLGNCGLTDAVFIKLCQVMEESGIRLRKFSIANSGELTDNGLKFIGGAHGPGITSTLHDLCIAGCFRVTDLGIMSLSFPSLRRVNFCGCYKVTDGSRRYVLGLNPHLLIYNSSRAFGKEGGGKGRGKGTFYDVEKEGEEHEEEDKQRQEGLEQFRKKMEEGY